VDLKLENQVDFPYSEEGDDNRIDWQPQCLKYVLVRNDRISFFDEQIAWYQITV